MFEALILGIVQGLTEFFPVSSTAHLILFPWFFGWSGEVNSLTFDVALHAGTLAALLIYFYKDWIDMLLKKRKLLLFIICASVPGGLAGFFLNDFVEKSLRSPIIICASLIIGGIFMFLSEKMYKHKKIDEISLLDAMIIGFSQAVALIPGVSRSGITISTGMVIGIERESAARFSFLLSTPVVAGAALLHGLKIIQGKAVYDPMLFSTGFLASFITGFAAIAFLLKFFRKYPLNVFVYYRFVLAVVIMEILWLKG